VILKKTPLEVKFCIGLVAIALVSTGCAGSHIFPQSHFTSGSFQTDEAQPGIRNPFLLDASKLVSPPDEERGSEGSFLAPYLRDHIQTSCSVQDGVELSLLCQDSLRRAIEEFCNLTSNATLVITPTMVNEPDDEYINGPTVIKVPEWVANPLGTYYMYFADHRGDYIRAAFSESLRGPWTVIPGGIFHIEDAAPLKHHIASPDVWVDDSTKTIWLSLHGVLEKGVQSSILAESVNGIEWSRGDDYKDAMFSPAYYVRVFEDEETLYTAVPTEKGVEIGKGKSIAGPFEPVTTILTQENPKIRHIGVGVVGRSLHVYFSRVGDTPERIMRATVDLSLAPSKWDVSLPVECVRAPQEKWEGAQFPLTPSERGPANRVNQLRDPFVYIDETHQVLFYSVGGESGLAVADLR
jgi:hypothetical protein